MAITTYAELQTAIATLLNRDDLTAEIPTFIRLAEAELTRKIDHWNLERRAEGNMDTRYTALPDGFRGMIRLHISTASGTQEVRPMSQANIAQERMARGDAAGVPCFYALTSGEIEAIPTPDGDYPMELTYKGTLKALSDTQERNWLLDGYPDAYLYTAALHSAPFLAEDSRLTVWGALSQSIIDSINAEGQAGKYGGADLRVRINSY